MLLLCCRFPHRSSCSCSITSDRLLNGFGQLGVQHVAKQLTSLSVALSCAAGEAQWQTDVNMLAALAQLSELRRLDVGNCLFVPTDGVRPFAPNIILGILQIIRDQIRGLFHDKHTYIKSYATCVPAVLHAGRTACAQLSTLRKLTSLTAGQRPTQHLQAMLPALRILKRLRCRVPSLQSDGAGALPALSELKALTELHITRCKIAGDYRLAFPPSLQVHKPTCFCMLVACTRCECTPACRVQLVRTRKSPGFPVTAA
jgi:hypothetical protein